MLVWTEIQTIATCIGLVAIALTVGTLIHQRHLRLRDNDRGRDAVDPEKTGIFVTETPPYWRALFGSRITRQQQLAGCPWLRQRSCRHGWLRRRIDAVPLAASCRQGRFSISWKLM